MDMSTSEIIAFIVMAIVAGTAAVAIIERRSAARRGRWLRNLIVGIIGALVGQFLFKLLDIEPPEILQGTITLADILIAFLGAILVLFILGFLRR